MISVVCGNKKRNNNLASRANPSAWHFDGPKYKIHVFISKNRVYIRGGLGVFFVLWLGKFIVFGVLLGGGAGRAEIPQALICNGVIQGWRDGGGSGGGERGKRE